MSRSPRSSAAFTQPSASPVSSTSPSIFSTRDGAPPCNGPLSAPTAAERAAATSAPVEATTRAVNVEAFIPCSAAEIQYASIALTWRGSASPRQRMRDGGRKPRLEPPVDEQAPDALVADRADEVLDVDAAIAQRPALPVGLGDLRREGDDAFESGLHVGHAHVASTG